MILKIDGNGAGSVMRMNMRILSTIMMVIKLYDVDGVGNCDHGDNADDRDDDDNDNNDDDYDDGHDNNDLNGNVASGDQCMLTFAKD